MYLNNSNLIIEEFQPRQSTFIPQPPSTLATEAIAYRVLGLESWVKKNMRTGKQMRENSVESYQTGIWERFFFQNHFFLILQDLWGFKNISPHF